MLTSNGLKHYQSGIFISTKGKEEDTEDTELDVDRVGSDFVIVVESGDVLIDELAQRLKRENSVAREDKK